MKRCIVQTSVFTLLRLLLASGILAGLLFAVYPPDSVQAALQFYARDNFDTVVYSNNNGSVNWAGSWIETDTAGAGPAAGNVRITGGELRIGNQSGVELENISRRLAYQAGASQVMLSFDFHAPDVLDASDSFIVDISANGGTTWATLETISVAAQGSRVYEITSYLTAVSTTLIRLRVGAGYTGANDYFFVNTLQVTYQQPSVQMLNQIVQTVQTYYIPVPEDQLNAINTTIYNYPGTCTTQGIFNPSQPINTYLSIAVVTDGTLIYFDHWEDGFESEINRPGQTTSEVWGDNNPANGAPPGLSTDVLQGGTVILLRNPVQAGTRQAVIDYDGGDKLASTEPIAVTHLGWNSGSDTLLATAEEMLDTSIWDTQYDIPVGANVDTARQVFEYTRAVVMASEENTRVYLNGNLVSTINQGQSYLTTANLNAGDTITASAAVQVTLYTGDQCANFESRSYTLYPTNLWSSNYYNPVSTGGEFQTSVILFNPGASALMVNWSTAGGAQTAQSVPARATARVVIPDNVGSRFYSNGEPFFALAAVDANDQASRNQDYDWGYTLAPANQLTQQALVGFGMGHDPTKSDLVNGLPVTNGAPVWLTVAVPPGMTGVGPFDICVDNNSDGLGALTDRNGHRYDQLFANIPELGQQLVYDPDGDQTGMLLYVCGANDGDARIAVAWGEDPAEAPPGSPGFDGGTSVPPLPNFVSIKNATLTNDLLGNGLFDVGDTFSYDITIKNAGALPIAAGAISITDIVPPYTFYVPGSASFYNGSSSAVIADDAQPATAFPLDGAGYSIAQPLPIEGVFTVSFRVRINPTIPGSVRIRNQAHVSGLNLVYDPNIEIVINSPDMTRGLGDFVWNDLDGNGMQDAGEPGIEGVLVELEDGVCISGLTCLTDVTDSSGAYFFPSLAYGSYMVHIISDMGLLGLTQTGDPDSACPGVDCDEAHRVMLTALNAPYRSADFGYFGTLTGSVGDRVWNDLDGDGGQDSGESGLAGVQVWVDLDNNGIQDGSEPGTVTDANGYYQIRELPAGAYTLHATGTPVSGATATYDLDGAGTTGVAGFTLTGGQVRVDADFGYRFAALAISKTSGAAGLLLSGDRVQYTIVARNNTTARQTNIAISDNLPAGTSFVGGGSRVSGFVATSYTHTYADDFRSQVYNNNLPGSQNWAGGWIEDDGSQSPTTGDVQVVADGTRRFVLRPGNNLAASSPKNGSVYRIAGNLSACTSVNLSYSYRRVSMESADNVYLDLSSNGGVGWTQGVQTITNGDDSGYKSSLVIDVSAFSANLGIRFRGVLNDGNTGTRDDRVFIDDVVITCSGMTIGAVTNQLAGNPPTLIVGSSNYALDPGQSMTLTYSVSVNNLLPVGLTQVINTAAVTSAQQPAAQTATTQDQLPSFNIGNRVWLDEDSDGWQNAGESGLANVMVELWNNAHSALLRSTITDSNGGYLFEGLPAGTYQVDVLDSSLPAGLVPTIVQSGGKDLVSHADPYSATVTSGVDNLTADFGYNWVPASNVTGNTGSGAIGDRVWIDANANGRYDGGEAGMKNVTVQLLSAGADGLPGTADDQITATVTDQAGSYRFDDLNAGGYIVRIATPLAGYVLTGDPDQFGEVCTLCDHQTGAPVLLGPGDVFVNVDFGYRPESTSSTIGNLVYFDRNANGSYDGSDNGIEGVTVALIADANANGASDTGEFVIATSITGSAGDYQFAGLPAGDYLVWVNDTAGRLASTHQTDDPDGENDRLSRVYVDGSGDNLLQDHGFTAAGHTSGAGLIGNLIFLDRDGNGTAGAGEGLEGIKVSLYDSLGSYALASTYSSAMGEYTFGGLTAGTYRVSVSIDSLPVGVSNTTDPDLGAASQSLVTLGAGQARLDQNFGYRSLSVSNTIGGTLWVDEDADGFLDSGESGRYSGVGVVLIDSAGDVAAATTSGADGSFLFGNQPNGTYAVMVSDTSGRLHGARHTTGAAGVDGNSQEVYYSVTVSGGQTNLTADFGYTNGQAGLGNRVWIDDGDGVQEDGELGLPNVSVLLNTIFPGGVSATVRSITDVNGYYNFNGLLLDEQYTGSGSSEPIFTISIPSFPAGYRVTQLNQNGDASTDSNDPTGTLAPVSQGLINQNFDFGLVQDDTKATLGDRVWNDLNGDGMQNAGEQGVSGALVVLYRQGVAEPLANTISVENGTYLFSNLDPGDYRIHLIPPSGYTLTTADQGDDNQDSDIDPSGYSSYQTLTAGQVYLNLDGGLKPQPTAVTVYDFYAKSKSNGIWLYWQTATEIDNMGFNLYAQAAGSQEWTRLNAELIPVLSPGSLLGASYEWWDPTVDLQGTVNYRLEAVDVYGIISWFETNYRAAEMKSLPHHIYIPVISNQ